MANNFWESDPIAEKSSASNFWDADPVVAIELQKESGFLSNIGTLAKSGYETASESVRAQIGGDEDIAKITAERNRRMAGEYQPPELLEVKSAFKDEATLMEEGGVWNTAKGITGIVGEIGKQVLTNPKGVAYIGAEQAANMAAIIAGRYPGVVGGSAIGAAVPLPGAAIVGGLIGGAATGGTAEYALEAGGATMEGLARRAQTAGVDIKNEDAIRGFIQNNPQALAESKEEGAKKGFWTALVDQAMMGVSGRIASTPARAAQKEAAAQIVGTNAKLLADKTIAKTVADKADEILKATSLGQRAKYLGYATGTEMIGGMGSEAAGQYAAYNKLDWNEIALEGLGELVTGPIEAVAVGRDYTRDMRSLRGQQVQPADPVDIAGQVLDTPETGDLNQDVDAAIQAFDASVLLDENILTAPIATTQATATPLPTTQLVEAPDGTIDVVTTPGLAPAPTEGGGLIQTGGGTDGLLQPGAAIGTGGIGMPGAPVAVDAEGGTTSGGVRTDAVDIQSLRAKLNAADQANDLNGVYEASQALDAAITPIVQAKIDAGEMPVFKGKNLTYAIHPATDGQNAYQVTTYNDTGALGDTRYKTLDAAIKDARLSNLDMLAGDAATSEMDRLAKAEGEYQARKAPAQPITPKSYVNREAVVFQNRDRSTPALISQMQGIAKAPDYTRVAPGYEATSGAPIVEGELPASAVIGKKSIANTANKKLEVQYAVVEADDLIASHSVDGSPVAGYEQGEPGKLRAIGGNARVAGIKEAYRAGSANEYADMLRDDTAHGVPAEAIAGMKNPVLVRIMRSEDVTPNIGIELNARTNAAPQIVDQAKDDARSFKIENIELHEDGSPSSSSLKQFVLAMPENERAGLMDRGQPNKNAQDRLNAAIFYQAYGNDELVRIYAESTDEEAKAVINALAMAAPSMAKLEGADVDVRDVVTDAAKIAINARRSGKSLLTASQQMDIEYAQPTMWLVRYFAENIRAPRRIGEMLTNLANRAYDESAKQGEDIFGEQIPKKNVEQILQEQGYEPRATQGNEQQVRPELISGARRGEGNEQAGRDEAQAGEGAAQPTKDYGDLLSSYSAEELKDRKAQLDAIEKEKVKLEARLIKEEKDRLEHEDIKRRSVAAASTFTLGGDAVTNLSGQSSLFQKAKHYDPNQLLIQLNDQPLRPGEDTEQTRNDRAGLAASVLVRGHRGSLLGLAIATDWITGKGSSLLGKRVTSPADLATLGAALRDPRAETFRYFLVKEGKVVYHTAVSSRMLGSTGTFIGEPKVFLADLKATMEKLGADSYYLMHNHPARLVEASKEDIQATEYIANKLPGFLGHVILDHTEFGLIETTHDVSQKQPKRAYDAGAQPLNIAGQDPTRTTPIPHANLDEVIKSPEALARMADAVRQPDNIVLVAVDHQMRVTGIMQVSRESMKKGGLSSLKIMARLRKVAGAHEIFAILPDGMEFNELPNHITKNGWLLDVHIAVAGRGVSAVNENLMAYQRGGAKRKDKLGMAVDQPYANYQSDLFSRMEEAKNEEIAIAERTSSPQRDMFAEIYREEKKPAPVAAHPAEEADFEHSGYVIRKVNIKRDDKVKQYWSVQTEDNRQLAAEGKREIGGDTLHETKEAAIKEAERQVKFAEQDRARNERIAAEEADSLAKGQARKSKNHGLSISERKANAVLDKDVNIEGKLMSLREAVGMIVNRGGELKTEEVPRIQPMSRKAYFRADNREQEAHEKRMKEAGNKTLYYVGGYDLGKTAFDYALSLKNNEESDVAETEFGNIDQEQQATAILDRANITGKDRLDIMREFKDGKHSLEDLEAAYPDAGTPPVERGSVGAALTKEQKKSVLKTLVDVYKTKGAEKESKGLDRNGNERMGYAYQPELFEKSEITGAMVRYYVTLPDGRIAHPTELFPEYTQSDIDAEMSRRQNAERNARLDVQRDYARPDVQFDDKAAAVKYWGEKSEESKAKSVGGWATILSPLDREFLTNGEKFIMVPSGVMKNGDTVEALAAEGWKPSQEPKAEQATKPRGIHSGGASRVAVNPHDIASGTKALIDAHSGNDKAVLQELIDSGDIRIVNNADTEGMMAINRIGVGLPHAFFNPDDDKTYVVAESISKQNTPQELRDLISDEIAFRDSRLKSTAQQASGEGAQNEIDKTGGIRFSKSKGGSTPSLIIQHNLSESNLLHAERMGGIPIPSLAITQAEHPMTGFGEITLVGGVDMADPKGYAATKVFGADIYSPRYPQLSYKLDSGALKKLNEVLSPYREGRQIYGGEINRIDDVTQIDAFRKYAKTKGFENKYYEERVLAEELMLEVGAEEKIFQGFNYSGNRKYIPHTLDNVIKLLKKELRGGESFNYGVGTIRSKFTPQFKSIKQIQDAKDRLMDKAAFEKVKDEIDKEFFSLAEAFGAYHPIGNRIGFGDTMSSTLYDAATMGLPRAFRENGFEDVPPEKFTLAAEFLDKLRTLPTEYFEAKILRAVDLSEFKGAVVPEDISQKALDVLKKRGINNILKYKGDADRAAKIKQLATEAELMFSQSTNQASNPHTLSTLTAAIDKAMGKGFAGLLKATGKFKLISSADIGKYLGDEARFSVAQDQTDTPAFKKWFKNSKITDATGKPLILYHGGTRFDAFRKDTDSGAHYATDSMDVAQGFASQYEIKKAEIKPLYLRMENPLDLRTPEAFEEWTGITPEPGFSDYGILASMARNNTQIRSGGKLLEKAKAAGYDGIIFHDTDVMNRSVHTSYAFFDQTQAKLAPDTETKGGTWWDYPVRQGGNIGTFEGEDIRYSADGSRILAFVLDGETHLVYDNISQKYDNVKGILTHEVAVHALELGKTDKDFIAIQNQVNAMRKMGNKKVVEAFETAASALGLNSLLPRKGVAQGVSRNAYSQSDVLAAKAGINKLLDKIEVVLGASIHGSVKPGDIKVGGNGGRAAIKQLSDLLVRHPAISKRLQSLDIQTQKDVFALMRSNVQDSEVFNSIVEFIPVDMMNVLARGELTSDAALHDMAVFIDMPATDRNNPVSTFVNVAGRLAQTMAIAQSARLAASNRGRSYGSSTLVNVNELSARNARGISSGSFGGIPVTDGARPVAELLSSSDDGSAFDTIDGRHDVTPSSDVGLGGVAGDTVTLPPIVSRHALLHEVMGYLVQENPDLPIVKQLIARIRALLRSIGKTLPVMQRMQWFKWADSLTDADVIFMASQAMKTAPQALAQTEDTGMFEDNLEVAYAKTKSAHLYSQLRVAIRDMNDKIFQGSAANVRLHLMNNLGKYGIKKDEIFWTGLEEFLSGTNKVSKIDVLAFLDENAVTVKDEWLGDKMGEEKEIPSFPDWAYDQGYSRNAEGYWDEDVEREYNNFFPSSGDTYHDKPPEFPTQVLPGGRDYRELLITLPVDMTKDRPFNGAFKSSHYPDTPNLIAHVRLNTRDDAQGRVGTFLEEQQSDWSIAGNKTGFRENYKAGEIELLPDTAPEASAPDRFWYFKVPGNVLQIPKRLYPTEAEAIRHIETKPKDGKTTPPAPFVTSATGKGSTAHTLLSLKKTILYAIEQGHEFVSWTTGTQQKDRYSLSKQIDNIVYGEDNSLVAYGFDGEQVIGKTVRPEELPDTIGKDAAAKLLEQTPNTDGERHLSNADLDIGGEWADTLYGDENGLDANGKLSLMSQAVKEVARQLGIELKVESIDLGDVTEQRVDALAREAAMDYHGADLDTLSSTLQEQIRNTAADKIRKSGLAKQPSFTITPELRSKVTSAGMPLFSKKAYSESYVRQIKKEQPDYMQTSAERDYSARAGTDLARTDAREEILADKASRQASIPGAAQPPAQPPRQGKIPLQGGQPGNRASWDSPEPSMFDDLVYKLQDKNIDLKRVVQAIRDTGMQVAEKWNAYLQEELFHGRTAKRVQDFVNTELKPMMIDMQARGLKLAELDAYLHARHAKEANALIAQRDPNMQDGGSGMTDQQADDYFANLPVDKLKKLEAAAKHVDAIIAKTREYYASYGLVSRDTVDGWADMFQHYVPLMREDHDGGMGIGQGFSIKGKEVKHRTGSTATVVDIFANIAMQREKAIVRGEKNRVAISLAGLAKLNPNPDFWSFDKPPTERVLNEKTGLVEERIDPTFRSKPNVVVAKIKDSNGQVHERAVIFNEHDERAVRMAESMKNLDASQLNGVLSVSAKITRYFASINTQYNPVFGVTNLVRDVQGAALNLTSTPLAGKQKEVLGHVLSAAKGIYLDARAVREGHPATSKWAGLWEELQSSGGMTGYRDLYRTSEDRAKAIEHELDPHNWVNSKWGQVFTAGGMLKVPLTKAQDIASPLFDWLSDYNLMMEGSTRLSIYKTAIDNGMTKQAAASLAKNTTVNFNRKGESGQQAGALYAFFNAAMQGTARIGETVFDMQKGDIKTLRLSKTGKRIVTGGVLLGVMQALALAAAGFDDDEPPEFLRERSLIIPIGGKKYISIPMPLGFHALPNIGRISTEFAMGGFKKPAEHVLRLVSVFAEAFNPIGSAGISMQTIAPTALDPFAALAENKDWTGKPIYKEDFSSMKPTPGFTRNKDTASYWSKFIAEGINYVSGGTDYVPGVFSPTADQIDYLIGQVTGGVGRETSKAFQTVGAAITGEALPTYKIPLVGRFYGDSESQASQGNEFYSNLKEINLIEMELKGRREDGLPTEEFRKENPKSQLIMRAKYADKVIAKLRKQKRDLIDKGAERDRVRQVEERITKEMLRFNTSVDTFEARAQ